MEENRFYLSTQALTHLSCSLTYLLTGKGDVVLLSLLRICPCSQFNLGAGTSCKGNHVSGPTWLISESNAC